MRACTRYALRPLPDRDGQRASALLRDGRPLGQVPGAVLEAQFETPAGDVLFLTHDIPFEDQLDILLIDAQGGRLDQVALYGAYATGRYETGEIIDDCTLAFRFFGGAPWQVQVLPAPRLRLPFSDPRGVHRQAGLRKQLDLRVAG